MTHWLLTTDISDPCRLRRAARVCERFGERVQESVYWLDLDPAALGKLQAALAGIVDTERDSVRYAPVCRRDLARSAGEGLCRGLARAPGHWLV